ncbi:MAG: DUF2029 domain-containing protein [Actinobacteria bacterium]|nr:DUF2029 domain-containing protein [Actinomycetota bacterium]
MTRTGRIGEAFLAGSAVATGALLVGTRLRPVTSLELLVGALVPLAAVAVVPAWRAGVRMVTVAVLGAPLIVLAVVRPVHLSQDVWSYAMYGRMVAHYHVSPYTHLPKQFPHDPIYQRVGWRHTPSVYGPLFTAVSAVLMAGAGASTLLARVAFQGLAAVALVAIARMLWRRGASPLAIALLVLNPVVVVGIVNGGHNDLLVGASMLAAVFKLQERRPVAVGVLLAAAGLVKATALLAAVAAVVWAWRRWERRAVFAMTATMGALVGVAYLAAGGMAAVQPLRDAATHWSHASIWAMVTARDPHLAISELSTLVIGVVVLVVGRRWHLDSSPSVVMGAFLLAYLLAAPYVMPWYVGWALPLLALRPQTVLSRVAFVYASLLFVAYSMGSAHGLLGLPLRWSTLETQVFALVAIAALAVWKRRVGALKGDPSGVLSAASAG